MIKLTQQEVDKFTVWLEGVAREDDNKAKHLAVTGMPGMAKQERQKVVAYITVMQRLALAREMLTITGETDGS